MICARLGSNYFKFKPKKTPHFLMLNLKKVNCKQVFDILFIYMDIDIAKWKYHATFVSK